MLLEKRFSNIGEAVEILSSAQSAVNRFNDLIGMDILTTTVDYAKRKIYVDSYFNSLCTSYVDTFNSTQVEFKPQGTAYHGFPSYLSKK